MKLILIWILLFASPFSVQWLLLPVKITQVKYSTMSIASSLKISKFKHNESQKENARTLAQLMHHAFQTVASALHYFMSSHSYLICFIFFARFSSFVRRNMKIMFVIITFQQIQNLIRNEADSGAPCWWLYYIFVHFVVYAEFNYIINFHLSW